MLTTIQLKKLADKIKQYRSKYVQKKHFELDESATRIMINSFLTTVLEYIELEDIKTEYLIKGTYADYVIQLEQKRHVVIEVKAINIDLSDKHIRQSINYAANEGIDWVLLTNGKTFNLYRVIFQKPISHKEIFSIDLTDTNQLKKAPEYFQYLTKKCLEDGSLEKYWDKFQAVEPQNLCRYLYSIDVVKFLRKSIKIDKGLNFSEEEIFDSIHQIITIPIDSEKPKGPIVKKAPRRASNSK